MRRSPAIRRATALLLVALAAPLALVAQNTPVQAEIAPTVVYEDRYPTPRVQFPGGVIGLPDVTYTSRRGYRPLALDLYLPPGEGPRPFVVYVHGGAWLGGTPRTTGAFADWPAVLASLAARGYVVASVEYRLAGEAPFPAALHDVKEAIRWLRENADRYGIDEDRGLVWGASAGGQLASLVAVSCGVEALGLPARDTSSPPSEAACVQAAVAWYGVSDFVQLGRALGVERALARPGSAFLRCDAPCETSLEERARLASPVTWVDAEDPPFLLIHGTEDTVVPSAQSRRLQEALQAKGVRAELLMLPGVGHSFLGPTPEATRTASRRALQRTFAFIDETIGNTSEGRASAEAEDADGP